MRAWFACKATENAARPVLAATHNAGGKYRREGIVVELNDEREHQVELVAVLSREIEAKNVTDGADGLSVLFSGLDRNASQGAYLGSVGCSRDFV